MALVHLTCAEPVPGDSLDVLRASAAADRFGVHRPTDDPAAADLVVFVESWRSDDLLTAARTHPLARRYPEKTFAVSEADSAVPVLPGLYTSNGVGRRWYRRDRVRTGFYLSMYANPFVYDGADAQPDLLYSFAGAVGNARVRHVLAALDHPADAFFGDFTDRSRALWATDDEASKAAFRKRYADELVRSRFVLCPRGFAPSSVRVFDTMQAGRVPVVLSDAWVPPEGPDWAAFSVRVAEADAAGVPDLLRSLDGRAAEMGRAARAAWEAWYAPEARFHRVAEWCLAIRDARRLPERLLRFAVVPQFFRRDVAGTLTRPLRQRLRRLVRR